MVNIDERKRRGEDKGITIPGERKLNKTGISRKRSSRNRNREEGGRIPRNEGENLIKGKRDDLEVKKRVKTHDEGETEGARTNEKFSEGG